MRMLILGGYGIFGGRLAHLLQDEPQLTLLIAGRQLQQAQAFCDSLVDAKATLIPIVVDRQADLLAQLTPLMLDVVVDATGPFQQYGDRPYALIEACLQLKINYLDLADGSVFVDGVSQFDATAITQGVFILSGVSSFPVLTAAVVRRLAQEVSRVEHITGGIAPSPYAGVGLNVIRAIASYAGQPLCLHRDGQLQTAYAFTEYRQYTIAPPACVPLRSIHFSLVDVPDLRVIPHQWPQLSSIWMGAGPVPKILHRILNGLAGLVKLRLIPTLAPAARLFYWAINRLVWGEHRGGMFVEVEGRNQQGQPCRVSWHLLAEGDDGPLIPSMAIEAIIRQMLTGKIPPSGARPATETLTLDNYQQVFAKRQIRTGIRHTIDPKAALYQRILGEAWPHLPPSIQQLHQIHRQKSFRGQADITRGSGWLVNLIANIFGFPHAGQQVPLRVDFQVDDAGREHWHRQFADHSMRSIQYAGQDQQQWLLIEQFGWFRFAIALVLQEQQLHLVIREWSCLGISLPLAWAPQSHSYEYEQDGQFHFHVEIAHAWLGLIVLYQGFLLADEAA